MAAPIWKDYIVDLGEPASVGGGVSFYIYSVSRAATIYEGVAYARPGETHAFARINDICADYLAHYFMQERDAATPARATFEVYSYAAGSDEKVAEVTFFNDWSYDPYYDPDTDGMNFPVVLTFAPGQYIPLTIPDDNPGTYTVTCENGMTYTGTPVRYQAADFNDDFNGDFLVNGVYYGDPYVINMADYPGAVSVEYGGRTWRRSDKCPRWVLYYVNSHGGWDALPVEGKSSRADGVKHYETAQVYDNAITTARGRRNYVNELTARYTFWTGWLNDQQSRLMHNLLNSPSVYVQDQEDRAIYPVVLTNGETPYKENPGKMKAYEIRAELAQDRVRM